MTDEHGLNLTVGQMICSRRKAEGLTQQDLADEVELSRTSITNIENGNQSVTIWLLYRLASALRTDPAALLPTAASTATWADVPKDVPTKAAALLRRLSVTG